MVKFRKKPVVIEAHQWLKNGDHPNDKCEWFRDTVNHRMLMGEGKIVRYFRHPNVSGTNKCDQCSFTMHQHGFIDTLEGGHRVCPGDWIITGVRGEHYPCKPSIFYETYDKVNDETQT